ncbi:MAG: rane protein [Proteobacteria bacterium]|nr:rane protein [Pseudomonadota bacterium]
MLRGDLDADYTRAVIGRSKRDYVWIMAREPRMADEVYQEIIGRLDGLGYDVSRIEKVPQRW